MFFYRKFRDREEMDGVKQWFYDNTGNREKDKRVMDEKKPNFSAGRLSCRKHDRGACLPWKPCHGIHA